MPLTLLVTPTARRLTAFSSAAIVLFVGIAVGIGFTRVLQRQTTIRAYEDVIRANDDVLQRLTDAETGQRGFVIVGDSAYLAPYRGAQADVERSLSTLRALVAMDAVAAALAADLDSAAVLRLRVLDEGVARRAQRGLEAARLGILTGRGRALMDDARNKSRQIEQRYAKRMAAQLSAQTRDARILFAVVTLGTALAAVVAFLLNGMLGRAAAQQEAIAAVLAQRNLEAERLREESQRANEAKSGFLAMMSHDLRTPLNAIGGYADLLDTEIGGPLTETQRGFVRRIVTSNRYLISMINDVLAFAKNEAGTMAFRYEPVRLGEFIATIEPMVAPQVDAARLTFNVYYGAAVGECPAGVMVDPEKLRQVVLNLVTNAIKFTPSGGTVDLGCGCDDRDAWIEVADTGPGIPADKLELIFKPFVQLDGTARSGVGLGLAISRELTRRMGGEITVRSVVGVGSTFTVRLPRDVNSAPSQRPDAGLQSTRDDGVSRMTVPATAT